jgi:predicted GNAT superfamily acetyltransferase
MREGRKLIKWTWDPMMARNAHFNLNRLGATVETYAENFYGIDYNTDSSLTEKVGLPSDRLIAIWNIGSERVTALSNGATAPVATKPVATVTIPAEWTALVKQDPRSARDEQARVRDEFKKAFEQKLVCAGFERGERESRYLLFEPQ